MLWRNSRASVRSHGQNSFVDASVPFCLNRPCGWFFSVIGVLQRKYIRSLMVWTPLNILLECMNRGRRADFEAYPVAQNSTENIVSRGQDRTFGSVRVYS